MRSKTRAEQKIKWSESPWNQSCRKGKGIEEMI